MIFKERHAGRLLKGNLLRERERSVSNHVNRSEASLDPSTMTGNANASASIFNDNKGPKWIALSGAEVTEEMPKKKKQGMCRAYRVNWL